MTALTPEQREARAALRRTAVAAISAPDPDLSAWYEADSIALEGVNKLDRPYIAAADPALIVAILDAQDAAESEAVMLRDLDPRDAAAVTEEHLAAVTSQTIQALVEGASVLVECPECEAEWAVGIGPLTLAALALAQGRSALAASFRKLDCEVPLLTCGLCILTGYKREGADRG